MSLKLQINSIYTFNTLAPAILGAVIKNAKLLMSCNFETAMKFENVAIKYEQIYPMLPGGSPLSPTNVTFHRFVKESGEPVLIAESWIDGKSVVGVSHQNFAINVTSASADDVSSVQSALSYLGVSFSITDSASSLAAHSTPPALVINNTYTFDTLAPAILGTTIKNAVLKFSCDFDTAMKFENVNAQYKQILPVLPTGSPVSPVGVIFHRFLSESGELVFFAEPWIDFSSLASVISMNFTINVVNATALDKLNILTALSHLGLNYSTAS